jgi:cardiolipin synthase A/B
MSSFKKIKGSNGFTKNKIKLIQSGKQYFDLVLQLISQATRSIHIQSYIFNDDETGSLVVNALKNAAKKNVSIYILADGYASKSISQKFIESIENENIAFRFFEPFIKSKYFYFGRRMHQKVMVVDGRYAIVGGMNIANRYNDMPESNAWLDFAIYAEGLIAKELCILCWKTWNDFPTTMELTPCEKEVIEYTIDEKDNCLSRIRRNDWVRRKNEISATYIHMLRHAQKEITIMCSYFLPGRVIRKLLRQAIARGVIIKLIVAGQSDVKIAKRAERWMYDWLLRQQIELYEYQPTVLHSKVAVCDESITTIGSYNINDISAYASIELNIDVKDDLFAQLFSHKLNTIIKNDCIKITKSLHTETNNLFKQFARWCSYKIFRIGFYMVTFYFKRKE